jgi:hypothetical protein
MNLLKLSAVLAATSVLPLVLSSNVNAQTVENAAAGVAVVDLPEDDDRSYGLGVAAAAAFGQETAIVAGQVAFYDDASFDVGPADELDDSVIIEAYAFGTDDWDTYEVETINWSDNSDPELFEKE